MFIQSPSFLLSMTLGDTTCKSELPLLAGEFNSASSPLHEIVEAKRVMIYVKSKRKSKHSRFLSSPPDCELLEEGTLHLSTQSDCCIAGRHLYQMIRYTNYEPDGPEKENCHWRCRLDPLYQLGPGGDPSLEHANGKWAPEKPLLSVSREKGE